MKILKAFLSIALACGGLIRVSAAEREEVRIGPFQSTIVKLPPPDPKEVERVRKWLQGLTTLDLIGHTEAELRRSIPFEPTRFEKDDRLWYWDGGHVIRNGDIIDRFHVFTVVDGKITRHEIIDRITGCALPLRALGTP